MKQSILALLFICFLTNSSGQSPTQVAIWGNGHILTLDSTINITYPTDIITLYCNVSDQYGNIIGSHLANWSTTGTLDSISHPLNVSRIVYETANISKNEEGLIIANIDSLYSLQVYINITGAVKIMNK
jgi:hypothetical protein